MNITIICTIITGVVALVTALINSRIVYYKFETKVELELSDVAQSLASVNQRLDDLSETDSCCASLQKDVVEMKDTITKIAETMNKVQTEFNDKNQLQNKTTMLTLRHTINEGYRIFKERGNIDLNTKDSLLSLGKTYLEDYQGNTFVEDELKFIQNLPVQ